MLKPTLRNHLRTLGIASLIVITCFFARNQFIQLAAQLRSMLTTPTNLTAELNSDREVELDWDYDVNEPGFMYMDIKRDEELLPNPTEEPPYIDRGLPCGMDYMYRVQAKADPNSGQDDSLFSAPATITTFFPTPMMEPIQVYGDPSNLYGEVVLTWLSSCDTGGINDASLTYDVEYREHGTTDDFKVLAADIPQSQTMTYTHVYITTDWEHIYEYRIKAKTTSQHAVFSEIIAAPEPASPTLIFPTGELTNDSVSIRYQWEMVENAYGYIVCYVPASNLKDNGLLPCDKSRFILASEEGVCDQIQGRCEFTPLVAGIGHLKNNTGNTQYKWKVWAIGVGGTSKSIGRFTVNAPLPGDFTVIQPDNTNISTFSFNLSWTPSTNAEKYTVRLKDTDSLTVIEFPEVSAQNCSPTCQVTLNYNKGKNFLRDGHKYVWKVKAWNFQGHNLSKGEFSAFLRLTLLAPDFGTEIDVCIPTVEWKPYEWKPGKFIEYFRVTIFDTNGAVVNHPKWHHNDCDVPQEQGGKTCQFTDYTVPLHAGQTYSWKVDGGFSKNANAEVVLRSIKWNFTVDPATACP